MLPKTHRLTNRVDFTNVYKNGRFFYSSPLVISVTPNGLAVTRIGFSVGKSFSKRAVDRNRAKRVMREAVRMHIAIIQDGFDVVISQKHICSKSYDIRYISDRILFILRTLKITKKL